MSFSSAIRLDKIGIWIGTSLEDSENSSTADVSLGSVRAGVNDITNLTTVETSAFAFQVSSFKRGKSGRSSSPKYTAE